MYIINILYLKLVKVKIHFSMSFASVYYTSNARADFEETVLVARRDAKEVVLVVPIFVDPPERKAHRGVHLGLFCNLHHRLRHVHRLESAQCAAASPSR